MKNGKIFLMATLLLVLFGAAKKPASRFTIFTIGDSTMANKIEKAFPETGWGQMLPTFFDTLITIQNHAVNGRSTKSFIDEGKWETVYNQIKPGDFVLIQFGHNDQKLEDPKRFTNPYTQYRANLKIYVEQTRSKGATPVLLTSVVRRNFNEKGVLIDTHGAYTEVTRNVAHEMNVALIDMQLFSEQIVIAMGPDSSKTIYNHVTPGQYPGYPEGKADDTHLNRKGATLLAGNVVDQLKTLFPEIKKHVVSK
jgi:lysophospholipase L1-like esterase